LPDVEVGYAGVDFDNHGVLGGVASESLGDVEVAPDVQSDCGHETFAVDILNGVVWSGDCRVADQNVDVALTREIVECGIDFLLVPNVCGGSEYFDVGVVLLYADLGVQEGLLATSENGNARCTGRCKGKCRLCTNAGASSCDNDALAVHRKLRSGS
jgi:hypothetical protein